VRGILEPIYEKEFCDCSLGFRKGKSQIDAINKIEEYKEQGYKWVLDADIKWCNIATFGKYLSA
jgi:retron-type reverse transcriptase